MFPDAEMCVTSNTFPSNVRFASALNASVPVAVNTLLSTPLDIKSDTSTLNSPLDKSKPVPAVKLPDISDAICAELDTILSPVVLNTVASTANVLFEAIVPPPDNPSPALIDTEVWSMCSFETKFVVASWSTCVELLIKVLDNSDSAVVNLVDILALG